MPGIIYDFILTAAHCCDGSTSIEVTVGDWRMSTTSANEFSVTGEVIMHPDYHHPNALSNDLCLLLVPNLSAINQNAFEPVCLASARPAHGRKCYAAGWGTLEWAGSQPDTLQDVGIWMMSRNFCETQFYSEGSFSDEMICAGTPDFNGDGIIDGGKDACNGDSGGPLVCLEDGVATLVGVTSWGIGCANEGYPGVWSSVADNLDWIEVVTTTMTTTTTFSTTKTTALPSSATEKHPEKFLYCIMTLLIKLFCL